MSPTKPFYRGIIKDVKHTHTHTYNSKFTGLQLHLAQMTSFHQGNNVKLFSPILSTWYFLVELHFLQFL